MGRKKKEIRAEWAEKPDERFKPSQMEKVIIDRYLACKLEQANRAADMMESCINEQTPEWVANNVKHWRQVASAIAWAIAGLDKGKKGTLKRKGATSGNAQGNSVTRGHTASGERSGQGTDGGGRTSGTGETFSGDDSGSAQPDSGTGTDGI